MQHIQFLDIIKKKMQSLTVDNLLEVLIYFGLGFVLGLVIKYSIRYFLWSLIVGIISLWAVQNFGIVSINYEYFKEFLNLTQGYTISDVLNGIMSFVYGHIGESLGLIFGFYLSWEIL